MVIYSRHDKTLRLNQLLRVDVDIDRVLLRFERQRSAGSTIVRPPPEVHYHETRWPECQNYIGVPAATVGILPLQTECGA